MNQSGRSEHQHCQYGELDVVAVETSSDAAAKSEKKSGKNTGSIIFMIHGYGANYHDLLPLAREMNISQCHWYFPNGFLNPNGISPLENFAGKAWFHIDLVRMNAAKAGVQEEEFMDHEPQGLVPAREKLMHCLRAILASNETMLDKKIFLGGFSQGAMLAWDLACYADFPISGLLLFSGALVNRRNYIERLQNTKNRSHLENCSFLQSHGSEDSIIPYRAGRSLNEFLTGQGFSGDMMKMSGVGHSITPSVLAAAADFIRQK